MHEFDRSFSKENLSFFVVVHLWVVDIYWFMKNLIKHHSVHYWMKCGFGFIIIFRTDGIR